jgi:hypothetical protein
MATVANLTVRVSAQIAELQTEFREANRSAEQFRKEFEGVATRASAFGNIIAHGVNFAVGALSDLARSVLENASTITDLSQKTGLAISDRNDGRIVLECGIPARGESRWRQQECRGCCW